MNIHDILEQLVQAEGSDVHIVMGSPPMLRVHGNLKAVEGAPVLTAKQTEALILPLLTQEQKDYVAVNKELDFGYSFQDKGRFRINVYNAQGALGAAMRLIPSRIKSIEDLQLPPIMNEFSNFNQGLVLLTGPTGEGKSTTLASIIDLINSTRSEHIVTIEDPIEFIYKNKKSLVQQREVGTHTASFATALKAALRESTDVILIGEMRDHETIALALTAAETGHLVLSTLHTSGAAKSVDRVIDIFPTEQQNQIRAQLAQGLRAVVWQQLLKTTDGKGRVAALEILFANNAVENLIRKGKTYQIQSVLETGMRDGMQTMEKSIKDLALQGYITQELADSHISALKTSLSESE